VKVPENISATTITIGKLLSVLMPKAGLIQLDANGVSKDPAVVEAYVNDLLVYTGKTTARLAAELLSAMQRVSSQAAKIHLPLLLLQGADDKLVDPSGAQMLYDRVSSPDKTLKMYEGLYHEVFNEPERGVVLKDMESWLEQRLAG
jgi:alpha-beta hydrolase superfamily lysophospholipase